MKDNKNELNEKEIKNEDEMEKTNLRKFRSKTIAEKLKQNRNLPKNINMQKCFLLMSTEISNRELSDIEECIPLFQTFNSFNSYMSLNENLDETEELLSEIAWIMVHKKFKKNTLIKKPGERNEYFYLLMTGKIQKVTLVIKREKITLEQYLIYLLKMKLIKEYEVLKKCRKINKSIMDINYNNIEYFCEKNPKYNYLDLLKKASNELINLGFDLKKINFSDECIDIPSIQNYLDVGEIKKDVKSHNDKGPKIYLYIAKYELSCTLSKGDYFGFLTKDRFNEYSSYICLEDCDFGYINKNKSDDSSIFEQINIALSKYFSRNKNKYYIFKDINIKLFNDNYSTFINYRRYKQGDKIILQGSLNEGVYFVKDGEIKINGNYKLNDLTKLMFELIFSLKGFKEHVPAFDAKTIIDDNKNTNEIKDNDTSNEHNLKTIDFGILKEGDILGLNELYDYNTSIYNFSAECISKEAGLFFINKSNFDLILSKENTIYESVIQKVELNIKFMIGTIKNYKKNFSKEKLVNSKKENSKMSIKKSNIYNAKYNNIKNLNQKIITSPIIKNKDKSLNEYIYRNVFTSRKNSRNKNIFNLNNNINAPKIRDKLFKSPFIQSQDKIIFDKINIENNRFNNFDKNSSIEHIFPSLKISTNYENKEKNLLKNNTYNHIINKNIDKRDYKLYIFTSPNNKLKRKDNNNNNFIFEKINENSKDKLPLLSNEKSAKKNKDKKIKPYFRTLFEQLNNN